MEMIKGNAKDILRNLPPLLRDLFSLKGVWVLLPAILATVLGYVSKEQGWIFIEKGFNEFWGIALMSICAFIFIVRAIIFRTILDLLLMVMAIDFLCREIHFAGTSTGVYVVAAIVAVVGFVYEKKFFEELSKNFLQRVLLCGTIWSYMVTLLIQRRFFKAIGKHLGISILPREQEMHIILEEITENAAHSMFILTGLSVLLAVMLRKKQQD